MAVEIITFGCRLNACESDIIRREAEAAGLEDTIIFNTCAVTAEATRQARQAIRRMRRKAPHARLIVTGCAAQIDPASFAEMDEVDQVVGNEEKLLAKTYLPPESHTSGREEKIRVNDIMSVKSSAPLAAAAPKNRARAFIQIQNGCDHRCTFCVIPYGRGNSRSTPPETIVENARMLAAQGYVELVMTGVDITSYGHDLPGTPSLGQLVRTVLHQTPELERLRLSSVDSIEIDDNLLRAFAEEDRLMPHIHLSLQSGDDMILKRMKRRHSRADSIRLCQQIRQLRPDVTFGADIIAGFPTETEAMFDNSLSIIDECDLTFLHVFPFSPRPGTPAAKMPQLDRSIVRERAAQLRDKGQKSLSRYLNSQNGLICGILLETDRQGRTAHYAPVRMEERGTAGSIVNVMITGHTETTLTGRLQI